MITKELIFRGFCNHKSCETEFEMRTSNIMPFEFTMQCPNCKFFSRKSTIYMEQEEEVIKSDIVL